MKKELKGGFYLIVFAIITAFLYNHFSPFGIALFGQWEISKGVVTANSRTESIDSSIEINNPEIVRQIIEDKKRIILDVRTREIYIQGHLPTSLNYPLKEFDELVPKLLGSIKRSDAVIVYCSSIECPDSHAFAEHLISLKYSDVKVFSGGFRQWQEMGYEIKKNEE